MVKLFLVRAMGSLYLTVQLRRSSFDVGMSDTLIFEVPVELSLELMNVIGSDLFDAERELFDDVIDKVLSVGLCVFVVNLERPDTRSFINSGILEAMAGHLLVVTLGLDFTHPRAAQQPAEAVTTQNASHTSIGDFDVVISR